MVGARNRLHSSGKENKQSEDVINVTPQTNQGALIESDKERGMGKKSSRGGDPRAESGVGTAPLAGSVSQLCWVFSETIDGKAH